MKTISYISFFILLLLISCEAEDSGKSWDNEQITPNGEGTGGSMARFTIAKDHLYTVDHQNLKIFDLNNPAYPEKVNEQNIGFNIETIFPDNDRIYIGSQWGMYIYDISNPGNPLHRSTVEHIWTCDPVVAQGPYAYVTLSSTSNCGRTTNELHIYDVSVSTNVRQICSYDMISPGGLGIDGDTLFVCDEGLKVIDVSNREKPQMVKKFDIEAYDVIPYKNTLFVIGKDGLYQYSYDGENVDFLSKISIEKKD